MILVHKLISEDDGRSDISSGSSLLSQTDNKDEDVLNLETGDGSPLVTGSKKSPSANNFLVIICNCSPSSVV